MIKCQYIFLFLAMNAVERKKIEQSIALLQEVLGQKGPNSGKVSNVVIPGFGQEVGGVVQIGNTLERQVKDLTNIFLQGVDRMQAILDYSGSCKKFSEQEKKYLQEPFMALYKECEKIQGSKDFLYHARAIKELLSAFFWVFADSPDIILKGAIESSDFNAMKFQKLKNQDHNNWWKCIGKAVRTLHAFVKEEYKMGLIFNPSGSAHWDDLIKGGGQSSSVPAASSNPAQGKSTVPNNNQQAAKKAPKKELQTINWIISNYTDDKVSFAPGEVQMKHGFFIQNCKDCTITINDKFKSLQMNKCENIILVINSCISGVEVMNGEKIEIFVKGSSPSIAIDKCQAVRIVLNEANMNCEIISSKVTQLNLSYESNGNEAKNQMVSEQLITRWNPNTKKYETQIYDKFL